MKSGQVTVLVLLLSLLGLTIALSLASRTASDLKQVSTVESGTRALAGAEAALEYGLSQLTPTNVPAPGNCTGSSVVPSATLFGLSSGQVTYQICSTAQNYVFGTVNRDDVLQANLTSVFGNPYGFSVVWKNPNAAVEITKVDTNNVVTRYVYNGTSVPLATAQANGFAQAAPAAPCVVPTNPTCGDASYAGGNCSGAGVINYGAGDKLLRVRPIYANTDIAVCAMSLSGAASLQTTLYTVTATASATNGTIRSVQASYLPGTLPSIFDSVFYSGASITK